VCEREREREREKERERERERETAMQNNHNTEWEYYPSIKVQRNSDFSRGKLYARVWKPWGV
jgi:hypothetical protein